MVTLTLRSCTDPLDRQIRRLTTCFRRLRQRRLWTRTVTGGLAVIELTYNQDHRRWHPHMHILCEGRYIPQAELSSTWHHVTGDSPVVDIRRIKGARHACYYVCKYISKGVPGSVLHDPNLAAQAIIALTGTRTYTTFGDWHGLALTRETDQTEWVWVGTLHELLCAHARGNLTAAHLLAYLRTQHPTKTPKPDQDKRPP